MSELPVRKHAILSPCGTYRYQLTRWWGRGAPMTFIMLNPSTADGEVDDPTIRRCMSFARRDGYSGIVVVNLYALRATDPREIDRHPDPDGPCNLAYLEEAAQVSGERGYPLVCAWGTRGGHHGRFVAELLAGQGGNLQCLGTTLEGHPRHPLYVAANQPLERFLPPDPLA
jgi:hypothetical protein